MTHDPIDLDQIRRDYSRCGPETGIMRLVAEVEWLRGLLGSKADGGDCTCTETHPGSPWSGPAEWEQDPWCPTHPNMTYVLQEVARLREHSITLNTVSYRIGEAIGRVTRPHDYIGEVTDDLEVLISDVQRHKDDADRVLAAYRVSPQEQLASLIRLQWLHNSQDEYIAKQNATQARQEAERAEREIERLRREREEIRDAVRSRGSISLSREYSDAPSAQRVLAILDRTPSPG
jgi:hypothetical protein